MTEISVIIPTYNRSHIVGDAIRSVFAQSCNVHEIIVVDDGSDDDTVNLFQAELNLPKIRYVRQVNAGAGAARNLGMTIARGDWIAFLDSDDMWRPYKIEHFLNGLAIFPDIDFYYSAKTESIEGPLLFDLNEDAQKAMQDKRHILGNFLIKTSTVMVRKEFVLRHTIEFGNQRTCEDYEFFWKSVALSRQVFYSPWRDSIIRCSENSLMVSTNGWQIFEDNVKAIDAVHIWLAAKNVDLELLQCLEDLRHWQVRNLLASAMLNARLMPLIKTFISTFERHGPLHAFQLAGSAMKLLLSTSSRLWLRNYSVQEDC